MQAGWQARRSALSHDWLRHSFIPALAEYLNVIAGRIVDEATELAFVPDVLDAWRVREREVSALLDDFLTEVSPRSSFERPPLSRCADATKDWLGDFVHRRWMARSRALESLEACRAALEAAETVYRRLPLAVGEDPNRPIDSVRLDAKSVREFQVRCLELGDALSGLPRRADQI